MFDLLVVFVIGLSTAFAALRGGLREASTLLALAIAGGVTLLVIEPALGVSGQAGSFFGTAIVAVLLVAAFFILAHIALHFALERAPLRGRARLYDRIGGGAFGFLRGLVLIGLGYLGYTYYLDEARHPDDVRNAITRPVAQGMADWFESFAPAAAGIDAAEEPEEEETTVDASVSGYDRGDRNTLSEIVTTVTTTDQTGAGQTGAPETSDAAVGVAERSLQQMSAEDDPIAEILQEDTP